ncbi:MAG TPA: phospho-sugar mutase [Pirellulales bacterium]|nr:phospho-sugar mutase [Pirellulales bacterium]
MSSFVATRDFQATRQRIEEAVAKKQLSPSAGANVRAWLSEPRYAQYADEVAEHVAQGKWKELDDVFWTVIPFGTGGRRGKMYPIGSNAINDRTIGESAQGLAEYVKRRHPPGTPPACAIAYDTRHRSRHFAELCGEIMVANGFAVYFLDGHRGTPELSFAVRYKRCACGIMVTASHNPPSDNAVKAYWSTGGQLLPPHDQGVIERVMAAGEIARVPFADALQRGDVVFCQQEVDAEYQRCVRAQSGSGPRQLKIIYSPMHGVGISSVCPVLASAGFSDVEVFAPHAASDGDFPNVPGHVANPENPATFDSIIARAKQVGADLVLSTDPDADRLGCAAAVADGGPWRTFTGNQIGSLLAEALLEGRKYAGNLSSSDYVVKTLVTTEMIRRIADSYGVKTHGNLQVGFKWIAGLIDDVGPEHFVLGAEESHGFMAGTYVRDKDATVAAMLVAELAARAKAAGQTLHQKLDALYWQHGCHAERTVSKTMPGSEGMVRMRKLMANFRESPPKQLGRMKVGQTRDYQNLVVLTPSGRRKLDGPRGDMLIFDLAADGNYVAVRPSGTEPKVKFYLFAFEPPELLADLEATKVQLAERLDELQRDLFELAETVN